MKMNHGWKRSNYIGGIASLTNGDGSMAISTAHGWLLLDGAGKRVGIYATPKEAIRQWTLKLDTKTSIDAQKTE